MKTNFAIEKYLMLYMPWILALLFKSNPQFSFIIAWLGSFLIFYLTLSGWAKPLPNDLTFGNQLMRPIILVQIIFAGYMCCTSIFFFLDLLGYENFQKTSPYFLIDQEKLDLTAQCQRYYCLGHAAYVTGVLMFMKYPEKQKYHVHADKMANLVFFLALITFPVSFLFQKISGLSQFANQFNALSFMAGTLALAFAIPQRKPWNTMICLFLYFSNFYHAFISGFKEPIIISILVLGVFLYPNYKKLVTITFVPALILLFIFLPRYNSVFRENAWAEDVDAGEASQIALDAALNKDSSQPDESNWGFLTSRLSEMSMFAQFVKSTPQNIDYYGLTLLKQSAIAVVPRVFWPSKPITENLVMQRVYDAGVVHRGSNVSAKPAFVVDAYLSFGGVGVFAFLFLYGALAQLISIKAEKLFGGYLLGTALIFSGLFQIMWRGLSFEFIINTIFWSYISMLIIQKIMVMTNVLKPV